MISTYREIIETIATIAVFTQTWCTGYYMGKYWVEEDTTWDKFKMICVSLLFTAFGVVILAAMGIGRWVLKILELILNDNWIPVYAIWKIHVTGYEWDEKKYKRISEAIKDPEYKTLKKRWIYKIFTTALEKKMQK